MNEKKKCAETKLERGYCPFESQFKGLYRDTKAGKASLARGACHDTNFVSWLGRLLYRNMAAMQAVIRPGGRRDTAGSALACGLAGGLCHAPDPGPTRLANPNRF